jgi:hypothetical protein
MWSIEQKDMSGVMQFWDRKDCWPEPVFIVRANKAAQSVGENALSIMTYQLQKRDLSLMPVTILTVTILTVNLEGVQTSDS